MALTVGAIRGHRYGLTASRCLRLIVAHCVVLACSPLIAIEPAKNKGGSPQVEVYLPSVRSLVDAVKRSRTAKIYESFSGLLAMPHDETGEGFDTAAVFNILSQIAAWPDTSVAMTTYTQDREGRPRWAIRVDWPVEELAQRVKGLVESESAGKIVKDLLFRKNDSGHWQLELPDFVLAVLKSADDGAMILSAADLKPSETVFGQKKAEGDGEKQRSLVYCRLNMNAGDEKERSRSALGRMSMFSDVRYAGSLAADGQWRERLNLRWNPLLGMAVKSAMKKTSKSFTCPKDALAMAVLNLGMSQTLADSIAGLPMGTIGARSGGDMAFSLLPGDGFLPIPDTVFQFHARNPKGILKSIRAEIKKDTKTRAADDKPPSWHEDKIDEQVIFWRDPSADSTSMMSLISYRTVVLIEPAARPLTDVPPVKDKSADEDELLLVILQTPNRADDAVRRWKELRARESAWTTLPSVPKISWEALINWKAVYAIAEPALSVFSGFNADAKPPASVEELGPSLSGSQIHLKIEYAGLDARHNGPIPLGAVFVPGVTAMSLSETGDADSEAQRERVACRNLRVLYHHAKLFKDDYHRWPANVAELDGYVDFNSNPDLLTLRSKDAGFAAGFVSMFTKSQAKVRREEGEQVIDDTLYVIEGEGDAWRLAFRDDQFNEYQTIYIDVKGEIQRVAKNEKS